MSIPNVENITQKDNTTQEVPPLASQPESIYAGIDVEILKQVGYVFHQPTDACVGKKVKRDTKISKRTGYYIVPDSGYFYYYKIPALVRKTDSTFTIKPPPEIFKEGFVVIDKELVYVTVKDLEKRTVRISRTVRTKRTQLTYEDFTNNTFRTRADAAAIAARNQSSAVKSSISDFLVSIRQSSEDGDDCPTGEGPDLAESKEIDLVIAEQERALFNLISEEEGIDYEIEEAT